MMSKLNDFKEEFDREFTKVTEQIQANDKAIGNVQNRIIELESLDRAMEGNTGETDCLGRMVKSK